MIEWKKIDSFSGNFTSPDLLLPRPCPLCGHEQADSFLAYEGFQFYSDSAQQPKRIDIGQQRCSHCSHFYMNPCYSDYGFQVLFAEAGASYGLLTGACKNRADWLKGKIDLMSLRSVLDLGCHKGDLLAQFPRHLAKTGVDIGKEPLLQAAQAYPEIDFICGKLELFEYDGHPDLITMFHVLEHLADPLSTLRHLRSIAHPKTLLALEVPVLEKGKADDVNGFFSVHHLSHFTLNSLKKCLSLSGWDLLSCELPGACRILAVPGKACGKGLIETSDDVDMLYAYLNRYQQNIQKLTETANGLKQVDRCVIWGAGCHTEILYHKTTLFQQCPERKYLIVDSDSSKWETTWRGLPVYPPETLREVDWEATELVVSSYNGQQAIAGAALALGVPEEKILKFYQFDVVNGGV